MLDVYSHCYMHTIITTHAISTVHHLIFTLQIRKKIYLAIFLDLKYKTKHAKTEILTSKNSVSLIINKFDLC